MNVNTAFRLAMLAVTASSCLALVVAGSETAAPGALLLMLIAISAVVGGEWPRNEKFRKILWNALALLALASFLSDFGFTGQLLPAVVKLVAFLTAFKLFNLAGNRDYFSLFMLSFLQLLAAAAISYDYRFAFPFALYVVTSCLAMMLYTFKSGLERENYTRGFVSGSPLPPPSTRMSWRRLPAAALVSLAVLVLTMVLFPFLPRVRTNVMAPGSVEELHRITGFSPVVDLGDIGLIKTSPRVIMRVALSGEVSNQSPPKLRGLALDHFDGEQWAVTMAGAGRIRQSRDGRYYLPAAPIGPRIEQEIYLKPLNTRIIFAASRVETLSGPFGDLYLDRMDSLYATRRNYGQIRYVVTSSLPYRDPQELGGLQADAGGTIQRRYYLQLPVNDSLTREDLVNIRRLAELVTQGSPDLYTAMSRLEAFLRTQYQYTLDLRPYEQERSKLSAFLFKTRAGHCQYFATAMVVMARSLGVPARIVNGFQLGQYNSIGGFYTVRAADAHSWVEVRFPERGWVEFDPTPAGGRRSEFASEGQNFWWGLLDSVDMLWTRYVLAYDAADQREFIGFMREKTSEVLSFFNDAADALLSLIPTLKRNSEIYDAVRTAVVFAFAVGCVWVVFAAVLRPLWRRLRMKPSDKGARIDFFERAVRLLRRRG